jgi:multidrug efflux pump subunit AcrA (membrane-fusion protein)
MSYESKISKFLKHSPSIVKNYKKTTAVVLVLVIGAIYYFFFRTTTPTVTLQVLHVRRGDLINTVSGSGQLSPTNQIDLKPKVSSTVTSVNVAAGAQVTQGTVLFRLDARDALKQVRDAELALQTAQVQLQKLKEPAATLDVISAQHVIDKAKEDKAGQDILVKNAYINLLNTSLQADPEVSSTSEVPPTISGTYLGGVEGSMRVVVYQPSYSVSGLTTGSGQISTLTPQPLGDSGLYIKFNSSAQVNNWIITIPNKKSTDYLSKKTAYDTALQNRETSNQASDRTIAEYTQKLADLQTGANVLDIKAQELSVQQKENALIDARQTLSDYTVVAPFTGQVASVIGEVGASASAGTSLGALITDKQVAVITLNEVDIAKVHAGQHATLSFDAIDGLSLDATVAEIDTLGTVTQNVVTYKVKLIYTSTDDRIKPGMSVTADIVTSSKEDVLMVSNQALKGDAQTGYYVEAQTLGTDTNQRRGNASTTRDMYATSTSVHGGHMRNASSTRMYNGTSTTSFASSTRRTGGRRATSTQASPAIDASKITLIKIPVTIGVSNDTQTEITSGLYEGQEIVIKKTVAAAKSTTAAPALFSAPRGGRGG